MLPRTDSEGKRYERTLRDEKGGVFLAFEDPTVPHLRRCSEKDTVAVSLLRAGHLLRFHTPNPCLAFGRYWRGGVAIELRPILQPTSLRARWTPCRDEFRVVRDDRRLVIMGAGHQERTSCALWVSWRVGILDAVIP
jgi:hypothetical protein